MFLHQFPSIAGAGPVTGPVMAMMFGWLPAFLWIIIGGIFFGAVQDFGALYASVKSHGKSMGQLIEDHIGHTGRKLFFLFSWLFTLLVIAAFADMVAGTFNGFSRSGREALQPNAFCRKHLNPVCVHGHRFRPVLAQDKDQRMETGS
ncbi:MAG: carbon starvation CstA family protein [Merdibacter sp.]